MPSTKFRSRAISIAAALTLGLVLSPVAALAQKSGGTLRVYHRDNPPSASIHEEATISTTMPFAGVFNNLVMYDPQKAREDETSIIPDLAESWSIDDAGTKVTFKLRQGVTWHDGKPFTSADVVCTWDLINGVREGTRKSPRRIWFDNVEKVIAEGDFAAVFQLKTPQPSLLNLLASFMTPIYPCHVNAQQMRTAPIGTGPFKFVEFKRNEVIRLAKNPRYWKQGRPYLDAIEFRIIPNRSTRVLAFMSGSFDLTFVDDITIPLLKDMAVQAPKAVCPLDLSGTYGNLMVNRTAAPFDNPKIREAMVLTIDRKVFSDILGDGKLGIGGAMMPLPEGAWGMPPEVLSKLPGYASDVEASRAKGRAIMESLGYTKDKPLQIKVTTRALDVYKDPAVLLIDQLKHVNITGELNAVDTTVWYNVLQKKDYTVALNVTGVAVDNPDANLVENFLCKSERNFTAYCNPEVDRLIMAQSRESDLEKRKGLVWEIEKKLVEDVARPVIFHSRTATCWQPDVKGITRHQNSIYNNWRFEDVWLDR